LSISKLNKCWVAYRLHTEGIKMVFLTREEAVNWCMKDLCPDEEWEDFYSVEESEFVLTEA
jgi:hypothetical protein